MKTRLPNKARKHTSRYTLGLLALLAAGALWMPDQASLDGQTEHVSANPAEPAAPIAAARSTTSVALSLDQAPAAEAKLPADAGILSVETVDWGHGALEVVAGELVVFFDPALSASGRDQLLDQLGSRVLTAKAVSGYVRVSVPAGRSLVTFMNQLQAAEGVVSARPNVVMYGAGNKCNTGGQYYGYQWHLARFRQANACSTRPNDPTNVKVAVLDTGVAYEAYGSYVRASDLASVPVVSPYDFVNNDSHANDDHQHGTHVATTLLGLGKISGVTPGATLMPIKVLDAQNKGSEFALAEGIRWAVDHGAKLLNMSLSFPTSYVPSGLLQDAVAYASAQGAVMVASTGNAGQTVLPYPAAFRDVVSVGATRMKRLGDGTITEEIASYSNTGPGTDLVAPGGSLEHDADLDGWPDGILAQTIRPQNPASTSYYFYSGTSQAAATASGVMAWLMAAGATPSQARDVLLETATDLGAPGYDDVYGQGLINLDSALAYFANQNAPTTPAILANIVPVVYKSGSSEWAVAKVRLARPNGAAVGNAKVSGRWSGSVDSKVSGTSDAAGWVTFTSPTVTSSSDGSIFALEINTVVDPAQGRRVKPTEFYYMSQGMQALLTGVLAHEASQAALLAFEANPSDTSLGSLFDLTKLTRCFVIKSVGPTMGTPGIGIVFTPGFIPGLAEATIGSQEIQITFGSPKGFGNGVANQGQLIVYNGGVGMKATTFSRSGGVGMKVTSFSRLGGVGLMSMSMARMTLDSAMITGMSADSSPVEIVVNEDVASFLSTNSGLASTDLGLSLSDTRCAANSSDVAAMDAVITAASVEEAESNLNNELGMGSAMLELGEEPPTGLITTE